MNLDAESTISKRLLLKISRMALSHIVNPLCDPRPISEGVLEDSSLYPNEENKREIMAD